MKGSCPICGAYGALLMFVHDAEGREVMPVAMKLPPELAQPVLEYLMLFRSSRGRALPWPRSKKLLQELVEAIVGGTIRRHGRDWAAPVATWAHALAQVLAQRDKLTLPLKDHAYLFEIVSSASNRVEGLEERAREESRRTREGDDVAKRRLALQDLHGEREARKRLRKAPMTPDEEANFLRLRGIEP